MSSEAPLHAERKLFDETRPFARERRMRSWWCTVSTLLLLVGTLVLAAVLPWWPARLAASVLGGLLLVRTFILFHDFMHGSFLRKSRMAKALFYLYGFIILTPPRYWRHSHNYHHAHVGKPAGADKSSFTSDVGSFPLMTTEMWRRASAWKRLRYRVTRHPLTLSLAYITVFFFGICLVPILQSPRKNWDAMVSLLVHANLIALIWMLSGFATAFFSFLLPLALASALGAYLFYAQHNYPGMHLVPEEDWTYYRGASESSSYMRLNPVMSWFTGNIGYHHVHHLNPLIPFYRLPEAMKAIPGLQKPDCTSLHPRDILACFRSNLWDPDRQRLVSYGEA